MWLFRVDGFGHDGTGPLLVSFGFTQAMDSGKVDSFYFINVHFQGILRFGTIHSLYSPYGTIHSPYPLAISTRHKPGLSTSTGRLKLIVFDTRVFLSLASFNKPSTMAQEDSSSIFTAVTYKELDYYFEVGS
ncbi:unnamed protein product [Arctogadus glacialis]